MQKKLYRSRSDKKVAGVCGGIARYLSLDATVIRVIWAIATAFAGAGLIAYLICALIMPEEPGYIEG